jgi:hypothetical protein
MKKYIFLLLVIFITIFGCNCYNICQPASPLCHNATVEYQVYCTSGNAKVEFFNEHGQLQQYIIYCPYTYTYSTYQQSHYVRIFAQNQQNYGAVQVNIFVDSCLFATDSSYQSYGCAVAGGCINIY